MKVLFTFESGQPLHTLWKTWLRHPPKGFTYVDVDGEKLSFGKTPQASRGNALEKLKRKSAFLTYWHKVWQEKNYSKRIDKQKPDLVYCLNGRVYRGKRPWVMDFENPSAITAFNFPAMEKYKKQLRKAFLQENCKAILPYSDVCATSFLEIFGQDLKEKVIPVYNAIALPEKKKRTHKGFAVLMTGSSNLPDDFYARGGRELVRAFLLLTEKYNDLKLILRSHVPEEEKALLKGKNVEIYEDVLSYEEFQNLFLQSDVYTLPGYIGYALSVTEAMGYGLPIITTNLLENGEPVDEGVNGFKLLPSWVEFWHHIPTYYTTGDFNHPVEEAFVQQLAEKIEILYNDPLLTRKMGKASRKRAEEHYTLERKQQKLAEVFSK